MWRHDFTRSFGCTEYHLLPHGCELPPSKERAVLQMLSGGRLRYYLLIWLPLLSIFAVSLSAAEETTSVDGLQTEFVERIGPLLTEYCRECHSTETREGELDLERFRTLALVRLEPTIWQRVAEQLDSGEMPPQDARQPTAEERRELRTWVGKYLHFEAIAQAGDPGPVVLRRLNNAQYTYTVRDLTGIATMQPAKSFPPTAAQEKVLPIPAARWSCRPLCSPSTSMRRSRLRRMPYCCRTALAFRSTQLDATGPTNF